MDTGGGCCIARYAATGSAYDMSKMNTIMLKFRPIAPKPISGAAVSDVSSSESGGVVSRTGGGAKRKYAKGNCGNKQRCNRSTRRRRKTTTPSPVVTLPLLPETPDPKDPPPAPEKKSSTVPVWLSFENRGHAAVDVDPMVGVGGSVVTVESVTDTWQQEEEEVLGGTDEERKVKLSEDTCPGFISDGEGRVTWTNGAYKEMVGEGGVWVGMRVGVPYRGFTGRVRIQYGCSVMTVPCDVWRMESGGFAWRLDVKAALSLSLSL